MHNASISSINKKVLTVHLKWHYSVPYLINFSNKLKGNNCSFKCYYIVASVKKLVVPLHVDQFGSFKGFPFIKPSSSQFDNKSREKTYYLPFTNVFNKTVYICHFHGS